MNYSEMIRILEATKKLRQDKKNSSPYVCDNLEEPREYRDGPYNLIETIRDDIRMYINNEWGVAEYLGKRDRCTYTNYATEVLNFRAEMIDTLIQRYKDKLEQPQATTSTT